MVTSSLDHMIFDEYKNVENYVLAIKALIQCDVDNGIIRDTCGDYLFDIAIRIINDTKVRDVYNNFTNFINVCNTSSAFNTPNTLLLFALIL